MKQIVIACGAGLATSSMVLDKVESVLKQNGIRGRLIQCTLGQVDGYDGTVDLIITTMKVRKKYQTPCITGSAFLTGIGEEEVAQQIVETLKA
ncbi:PTS sugar transporter subunit IIB [Collinsella vaginalis]|uniref:PTS sugar transporter subunit IIB n=1 Tax=Collinsella vaginalis TaxID=1870987 RepID=UPI000A26DD1D|nr:PTS sugar transporter subunit IIB [Collinsella vaginalis]